VRQIAPACRPEWPKRRGRPAKPEPKKALPQFVAPMKPSSAQVSTAPAMAELLYSGRVLLLVRRGWRESRDIN
jgi:hypothetical protein